MAYTENWNGVPVKFDLLPLGTRRTGQPLTTKKPKFAVIHDTGNKNSTAQQNVNYYKNSANISWAYVASAHIFIDDKECIVCIPVTEKAWHVLYDTPIDNNWYGFDANDAAFGIEGCYFDDKVRTQKSLDNCARVMAYLCKFWGIDYKTQVPGHQDIQSDKIDPGNMLEAAGYSRNVANFDKIVAKYINGVKTPILNAVTSKSKKPAGSKPVEKPVQKPKAEMTQQDALKYALSLKGKYIDFDLRFAYQCMDVAVQYVYHLTNRKLSMWGDAKDALKNVFPDGWKIVKNTPDYVPPKASIAVWTEQEYAEFGHIAIVVDNKGGTQYVTVLEQNFDSKANSPCKVRNDDFRGLTHFIVPKFANETTKGLATTYQEPKTKEKSFKTIPKNLKWSNTAYFKAKADDAGVTICKANHNHVMYKTNETYKPGTVFYVFEIVDGWCRVYSPNNTGWVWYERLILDETYKPFDNKNKIASNLTVGTIPPLKLAHSKTAKFKAKADKLGVTICKKQGKDFILTNEVYAPNTVFYVFEIIDGWCRVYSDTNNGWVWRERLIIDEVF
ncbi:N-acetylmuramoyl-L-alanine amidase [Staphylococcus felis]|uniref:N-acetylmuramoyl-L-alanine amidase n=1 Tax=Staphylococcus felis TaxID=46127 RepID=UPI0039671D51